MTVTQLLFHRSEEPSIHETFNLIVIHFGAHLPPPRRLRRLATGRF